MDCGIAVSLKNGVRTIQFNNTKRKNTLTVKTFLTISEILNEDASNDEIRGTIFTGTGEYFTSGNDLSGALKQVLKIEGTIADIQFAYKAFAYALIQYPKLLVVIVNGPSIGIGVTMCGLCDLIYATENATFMTPFVKFGITIEGCSTDLLPKIMGHTKANEMLLLGRTITAHEALQANLVSKIIPQRDIANFVEDLHKEIEQLNMVSFINNKKLMKEGAQKDLLDTFHRENDYLSEALNSENYANNMALFAKRKSKL